MRESPATHSTWGWQRRYRVWDANRKVFHYPEDWIEPELRRPPRLRAALLQAAAWVCPEYKTAGKRIRRPAHAKAVPVLLFGRNKKAALVAALTLARELDLDLYRVDLGEVVSKYIGETEKNLRRLFAAAKKENAILFFDEADALFGKRTEVKDGHDHYANVEINYLLQCLEAHRGLSILALSGKGKIDPACTCRFAFVISLPRPTKKKPTPVPRLRR